MSRLIGSKNDSFPMMNLWCRAPPKPVQPVCEHTSLNHTITRAACTYLWLSDLNHMQCVVSTKQ